MKTTITIAAKRAVLILILFLGFQIHQAIAKSPINSSPAKSTIDLATLAPVVPKEATFDDVLPEKPPVMVSVAPVPPKEATFEEDDNGAGISNEFLREVAPVTPQEADFNDSLPETGNPSDTIKFDTPAEASFSDF
jgi:hypothetical protein